MKFVPQLKLARHKQFYDYMNGKTIVPINIQLSVCGFCNANCPWCFYKDQHVRNVIDKDKIISFIKQFQAMGGKAITFTGGGQPTLHPDFYQIASSFNIDRGLITNGIKVNDSFDYGVFKWIRISRTNVDWPIGNFKYFKKCKTVGLCINYIGDQEQVQESLKVVYDNNLSYLQIRPALNTKGGKTVIQIPKIRDQRLIISDYKFNKASAIRNYSQCQGFHFVPFIWQNGDMDVCGYHRGKKQFNIGNIYTYSLSQLLQKFPKYVDVIDSCQICCKNHQINQLINQAKNINDINFV